MSIEEFVNDYLQEHRHDVLLSPYNGLIDFANAFKEQMIEGAVEGKVFMSFAPGHDQMVMADVDLPTNTKVKIIIVKEKE